MIGSHNKFAIKQLVRGKGDIKRKQEKENRTGKVREKGARVVIPPWCDEEKRMAEMWW